jgi:hypothetical protein
VFFFFLDESPFFIELHLPGARGKKPRGPRGSSWRVGPPICCSG